MINIKNSIFSKCVSLLMASAMLFQFIIPAMAQEGGEGTPGQPSWHCRAEEPKSGDDEEACEVPQNDHIENSPGASGFGISNWIKNLTVTLHNGNMKFAIPQLNIPAPGDNIEMKLYYNSLNKHKGPFGFGMTNSYYTFVFPENSDGSFSVRADFSGARRYEKFVGEDAGYNNVPGNHMKFEALPYGEYRETFKTGEIKEYNDSRNLSLTRDRKGNEVNLSYDGDGNITTITGPAGRQIVKEYSSRGRVIKMTDPEGRTYHYDYDGYDNLRKILYPNGNEMTFDWGDGHMLEKISLPDGGAVEFTYYPVQVGLTRAALKTITKTDSGTKTYDYYMSSTSVTDARGNKWWWGFDTYGQKTFTVCPRGNKRKFAYDSDRNLIMREDAKGNKNKYLYDERANLIKTMNQTGEVWSYTYDEYSMRTSETGPGGHTTYYEYDTNGNLVSDTDPLGNKTVYTYDGAGNRTSMTDPRGNTTSYDYDVYGNMVKVTDPENNVTEMGYDMAGNITNLTDAQGNIAAFEYDSLNRRIRTVNPDNTTVETVYYDATGEKEDIDENGNSRFFKYDTLGRLVKLTDELGKVTLLGYDENSNMISMADPNGSVTDYEYNQSNKLAKIIYPEVGGIRPTYEYSYDENGNVSSKKDPNGDITQYTYDAANNLTKREYPGGESVDYVYDSHGRVVKMTDSIGITEYNYNPNGQVTQITYPGSKTISYSYDSAGNLETMTAPSVEITTYTYNTSNILTQITEPDGNVNSYEYDTLYRPEKFTRGNGAVTNYTYDNRHRITKVEHRTSTAAMISSYEYTYDNAGNRLTMTDAAGNDHIYQYNARYELVLDKKKDSQQNIIYADYYSYDPAGNRLTKTDKDNNQVSYSYDSNNRLVSAGDISYSYDLNGNLTAKTQAGLTTGYEYNYENKMVKITYPDNSTNLFKYYGDGNRYEKVDSLGVKRYIYSRDNIVAEYNENDEKITGYTMGLAIDSPISIKAGETKGYYHSDSLGTVMQITGEDETVVNNYDYNAWGEQLESEEEISQPLTYTAREWDTDAGLYYYRARHYDPTVGRFTAKDPLHRDINRIRLDDINPYAYVKNNPVNYVDPYGEEPLTIIGIIAAGFTLWAAVQLIRFIMANPPPSRGDHDCLNEYLAARQEWANKFFNLKLPRELLRFVWNYYFIIPLF